MKESVDVAIIGAGQAGVPLSRALAEAGRKTALIEREHVGGTCINEGCTPTKTMVASARVAYLARRAADYGVHDGTISVDMVKVRQRKRDIVESFRSGSQSRIEGTEGLELIFGEARFVGHKQIGVAVQGGGERELYGDMIVINNYTVMHARTEFRNFPEPERQRRLIRLWLDRKGFRDMPEEFKLFATNGVPKQEGAACTFDFKKLYSEDPIGSGGVPKILS